MREKIIDILAEVSGVSADEISDSTRLVADLGPSSFDLADIVVSAEDEFGISIPDERFPELQTVGDVIHVICGEAE